MGKIFNTAKFGFNLFAGRIGFPALISIDVTNHCNLSCKHCYFQEQEHNRELRKEQMLVRINEIKQKYSNIFHATWVGGEPMLRPELIEEGSKLFDFNMIVSNGTIELPNWKNCAFMVSVDGTKEIYTKIRGDVYCQVMDNANRSDIKVSIGCVINKWNQHCVGEMLKEWSGTDVRGIAFDFYTPIEGIKEDLCLSWEERDQVINRLLELRREYGNFVINNANLLKLMKSKNAKNILKNCQLRKACISLDSMGRIKRPCILGEKADCSRCGCVIPYFVESALVQKNLSSLLIGRNLLI